MSLMIRQEVFEGEEVDDLLRKVHVPAGIWFSNRVIVNKDITMQKPAQYIFGYRGLQEGTIELECSKEQSDTFARYPRYGVVRGGKEIPAGNMAMRNWLTEQLQQKLYEQLGSIDRLTNDGT